MTAPTSDLVLLDSCVVSFLMTGKSPADFYEEKVDGLRTVISFQTTEESLFGAIKGGWGRRRMTALRQHLAQYDVVHSSPELVEISANLRSEREAAGRALNTADAWIAATALLLECPLASHDGDFVGVPDLELIRAPS